MSKALAMQKYDRSSLPLRSSEQTPSHVERAPVPLGRAEPGNIPGELGELFKALVGTLIISGNLFFHALMVRFAHAPALWFFGHDRRHPEVSLPIALAQHRRT